MAITEVRTAVDRYALGRRPHWPLAAITGELTPNGRELLDKSPTAATD
jgi:hypothetical protein